MRNVVKLKTLLKQGLPTFYVLCIIHASDWFALRSQQYVRTIVYFIIL